MGIEFGLLILRVALGLAVASHGAQKLFGWFGGYGLAGTGGFFESLGFKPGKTFAAAAGVSEFTGGLLLALGLFGALGPMLILTTMLVAIATVHWKNGFFASNNGIELPFVYGIAAWTFGFGGSGPISLDWVFGITATSSPAVVWGLFVLAFIGAGANLAVRKAPASVAVPPKED